MLRTWLGGKLFGKVGDRNELAKREVNAAKVLLQHAPRLEQILKVLRRLRSSQQLGRVQLGFQDFLVRNRNRRNGNRVDVARQTRLNQHAEHAQFGKQRFPRAAARAFDEEFDWDLVERQCLHVGGEDCPV